MEETGTVIGIEGRIARVRLTRKATCDRCGACGMGKQPEIVVEIPNSAGAKPGDEVRIAIASGRMLQAAAAVYLVPILALFAGYLLSAVILRRLGFGRSETPAIVGGFLAFALSFLWIRHFGRRSGDRFTPEMISVIPAEDREPAPPLERPE